MAGPSVAVVHQADSSMRIINDILARLKRVEDKTQVEFVAEFDTGLAIVKSTAVRIPLKDYDTWHGPREGVAYFRPTEKKLGFDYIDLVGGEHHFMKKVAPVRVDREGNAWQEPKTEQRAEAVMTVAPKPRKKARKSTIHKTRGTTHGAFAKELAESITEVGVTKEILKRDWKGKSSLRNMLNHYGRERGAAFSVKNRGSHYMVSRLR